MGIPSNPKTVDIKPSFIVPPSDSFLSSQCEIIGIPNELAALRRRVEEFEAQAARLAMHGPEERHGPEELCSATFEAISDPAVLVDLDNRIIGINSALRTWSDKFGLNTDVAGRDLCEAYPFLPDSVREDHDRRLRTGQPHVSEATVDIDGQRVTYEVHRSPVVVGGRIARVLHVIRNITARREAERALAYRLDLETLILTISSDFISLKPEEIDRGIDSALKAIGEFISVDRSYVFIFSDDGASARNTHEWCAEGIEPQIDDLQAVPTEILPWLMGQLKRNEAVHIPRLGDLPAEASALRETFEALGIRSVLAVPMFDGGRLVGLLGLDSVRAERTWTQDSIALLRVMAHILANALHRKQAGQALRESEQQYRSLVEDVPVGIYRTSPDGRILAANPALLQMLGFDSLDELSERNLEAGGFAPGHPRGEFKELIERQGQVRDFESTWVRRDGTTLNVREAAAVVRDADGAVLYYEGMVEDVTERRQTEETFRLAMEATSDALWDWNIETDQVYRSPRHATMLGYEPDELTSELAEWETRIHPDDRETVLTLVDKTLEGTCESFQVEYRLRSKTGEYVWVLGRGSVVERAEDGAPLRMVTVQARPRL